MKDLKEIINECKISFDDIQQNYKTEYDIVFNREKDWLNNTEDKTYRLADSVKTDIDFVISKLKAPNYLFTSHDTSKLSTFVSQINGIIRVANRINNFKEGAKLDNGKKLQLFELFNTIKKTGKLSELNFELNKNLNSFKVHLFSIIKHCQNPNQYPIYYRYWKNILGEVLKEKDDYDSLCDFYKTIKDPKHLSLGAYFGAIGRILASKLSDNKIIKEENDKNYNYIKSKILNIHYFDLITGYKRNPNYFLIYSKYGDNNEVDMFPEMLKKQVISVGFAAKLDLTDFYLSDESEIIEYLKDEKESQNSINALKHFLSIKVGDIIAVKASGSPKGTKGFLSIVGICEVIPNEDGKVYNYDPNGFGHTINVKYLEAPIYREYELAGYGSTLHHLSKEDHIAMIFGNSKKSNTFEKVKDQFDKNIFDSFIEYLRKIITQTNILKNDERVVFSVRDKRLNFTVGQRYCFNLYASNSKGVYGVISKTKLLDTSEPFEGSPPQPFYSYFKEFIINSTEWESIIESIKIELSRTSKSGYRKYNNGDFENYVFSVEQTTKYNQMDFSLNTILYGPPGTGKTYNTILRAAEIVENRKIDSYDEALRIFKDNLHNKIEFITFHQNYSYEDFIQGLRPETDNKSSLTFDKKDGVFKKIADKALENIKLSQKAPEELSAEALFNNALEKFIEVVEEEENYPINETAYIMEVEEEAFRYTGEKWTNHTNGLRMKFSDLKEFYKNGVKSRKDVKYLNNISGLAGQHATYYFLVYEKIIKLLPKKIDAPLKIERENYVIVIDEINRANISRVFGELITLIEPDKRSHGEIPLESKLPSGDNFIVPSNLYIIGTMNTADKSIALLDIALRRRFEFEPMYPLYDVKGFEIYDKDILFGINDQIIKAKGHDFQIGHAYFMGENKDLIKRMNKKVIPLLLEYFMNDEKEVKSILFNAGLQVEENSWPIKISGKRG